MSYPRISVDVRTPLAVTLQASIQEALAVRGFASRDDSVMAEYVLVMLANAKSKTQIDAELSELVGSEYSDDFTTWLWKEADRLSREAATGSSRQKECNIDVAYQDAGASSAPPLPQKARRSTSPPARHNDSRSQSPPPRSGLSKTDHWEARNRRAEHDPSSRDCWQQARRQTRTPRELFASAVHMAAYPAKGVHNFHGQSAYREMTMDSSSLEQIAPESKMLSIRGRAPPTGPRKQSGARRELFDTPSRDSSLINESIQLSPLVRADKLDPRAAEFKPSDGSIPPHTSLVYRMDPMIPDNSAPISSTFEASGSDGGEFPTKPSQTSLCRYSLSCTNPLCTFSHPSPSAAIAKCKGSIKDGHEPIITSESACRFGTDCTNVECAFSHISPAVTFIKNKRVAEHSGPLTAAPCRFADQCSNPSCAYAHFDVQGKAAPSPALSRLLNQSTTAVGSSEANVSKDSAAEDDVEIEVTTQASELELGADGKPKALDRPLGSGNKLGEQGVKPCRFGSGCIRTDCWFSHPEWRKQPAKGASPGATDNAQVAVASFEILGSTGRAIVNGNGRLHISDRLSRFNKDGSIDEEVERVVPIA